MWPQLFVFGALVAATLEPTWRKHEVSKQPAERAGHVCAEALWNGYLAFLLYCGGFWAPLIESFR
jgi:hypothetical protein